MNDTEKIIKLHNGWIFCPSKSFPGKFYYFNVLTGETTWSLNQADNKEGSVQIADKSHQFPEPTTLPDESIPSHTLSANVKKPDFILPSNQSQQVPTFGQSTFNYLANIQPITPNIVWTWVPFPMICPETKKQQIEREPLPQSSHIPLCKRFKNYERPVLSFDRRNKVVKPTKLETSTPKNEPVKFEPKLPNPKIPDVKEKAIISFSDKVETKSCADVSKISPQNDSLDGLESTDLRFLLLAKRKCADTADNAVNRKKPKPTEIKPVTPKKNVSFNLSHESDEDSSISNVTTQNFTPTNHTATIIETPTSPILQKDNKIRPPFVKENYAGTTKESTPYVPGVPTFKNTTLYEKTGVPPFKNTTPYEKTGIPPFKSTTLYEKTGVPMFKNKTWCIVVDTDVLLLDYELIDKVVLSDPNCKLVIPHAVAADIEALCLGDCRGQQRVINARQLTRKLSTPPPQYIVEPQPPDIGSIVVTTESILQCCIQAVNKNYYVVLITNDPHLQSRAQFLNIPSYKLNDIKYGVDISPKNTKKAENNKTSTLPDTKNQNLQNFTYRNPVEKLFLNDSVDSSLDDKLKINTTKPKCSKNEFSKCDIDDASDISSEVLTLIIDDVSGIKTPNLARNLFLPQNAQNGFVNFQKRILNANVNTSFSKTVSEKPVLKPNNDFHEDYLDNNFENSNKVFNSMPITNLKQSEISDQPEITHLSRQNSYETDRENKILNPSQSRINKIINTICKESPTSLNNQITKTKDSTGIFKIPQSIPIKNGTRNTTVHAESSSVNDKFGTRVTIDNVEESLKRFCVKSRVMRKKLETRIDEWICSFMQIMEDALVHVLQENSACMENTAAPLTLKETLNCIKMLYGNNTKIRDVTDKISALLDKCMTFVHGKLKMSLVPEDFMKILGCGFLLVLNLKNILPQNQALKEAEIRLNALQCNIENKAKEMDPEIVKSHSVSRTETDEEGIRPPFIKKKSYVIDYLKKHFKEWASYTEDLEDQDKLENHSNVKIVRTLGKNLNQWKIDSKTLSLSNTKENNSADQSKDGPKLMRLLENNQINKPSNAENVENIDKNQFGTKVQENICKKISEEKENLTEQSLKKQDQKNDSKMSKEFDFSTHENTFGNSEDGPKIIRNMKLIDEFEKKIKNKEPLDLDLLDYSEIYEPSVNENPEFDIISEKNNSSENNKNSEIIDNNNYGLTNNNITTLEDLYLSSSTSIDSRINNNYTHDSKNTAISKDTENLISNYLPEMVKKSPEDKMEVESPTFTEIIESRNDSYYENNNSDIHNTSEIRKKFETQKIISVVHTENSETAQDDSTNDSGFENDSTYAHSVVKLFLNELSTSFKVIYTFVTKFVEEFGEKENISERRRNILHNQASKSLEDMVAIIQRLKSIIKRESAEDTVLKTLLRNAGVEAIADKKITRYRQIVIKSLEQALILESALKIIVSVTIGDFEAIANNAETTVQYSNIRYFNIFE